MLLRIRLVSCWQNIRRVGKTQHKETSFEETRNVPSSESKEKDCSKNILCPQRAKRETQIKMSTQPVITIHLRKYTKKNNQNPKLAEGKKS